MIRLHVVPVQGAPFDRSFDRDSMVLGRASTSDLVLEDRFLSRHHSRLYRDNGQLFVEDLGSRNGTLLNGQRIHAAMPVSPGDVVKISGSVIKILGAQVPNNDLAGRATPGAGLPGAGLPGAGLPGAGLPGAGQPTPGPVAAGPVESVAPPQISGFGDHTIFRSASGMLQEGVAAHSHELEGEEALRRYAERLNLVNEVHRALGESMELEELLELILERVFDHLRPEQGAIYLRRDEGELERAASRALPGIDSPTFYSQSLVHEVTEKGLAALVLDVESDERFAAAHSILATGIRSLVAAPLLDGKGTLGMIVLSSRVGVRQFSEGDMELLVSLASIAALRLRNVSLLEEAAERRRLEQELALGRRIQVALLPDSLPTVEGYGLHAGNIPSRGVSGDYYQVLERNDGEECVLMVADVSGKGIAASLLTATLEALSAGPIEDGLPPETICGRLSRLLHRRTPPEKYATAFLAILEPANGRLQYTNAGHNPGLIVRASGDAETLGPTGTPIGLLPVAAYRADATTLEPGDTLVLYTDGITEPTDPDDEEYGLERLTEVCQRHRGAELPELAAAIANDLEDFVRGEPFPDDRTLVMVRRK
ncbi:MAG: SpoIIE family protein phosphatase [Acidobacteriota bacterium]